jgi:hypothetical protein
MWALYAQWRFRGLDPFEALNGAGVECPWPARREAVLFGFALHAADHERTAAAGAAALPGVMGG